MKLQESMTGFYYVGTKRANITKLVNIYKRGYASGKLNEAMTELLQKDHIQPQLIVFDAVYGFDSIKIWTDILMKNERLYCTPLIIDSENMNVDEHLQYIRNKTADDILNLSEWEENNLNLKIRFLQKYKSRTKEIEKQRKVESKDVLPRSMNEYLKRTLDVLISSTALVLLAPLFLLISLAIRMESKGNIFYVYQLFSYGK